MNRFAFAVAAAGLAAGLAGGVASAATAPPAPPGATAAPSADVARQIDLYRVEVNGRVSRGEINAEEADRLLRWREWQLKQQAAGLAPAPATYTQARPLVREEVYAAPSYAAPSYAAPYYAAPYDGSPYYAAPYYAEGPYYGSYFYGPRPYYWGPRICAGGFGRHVGGRVCF